MLTAPNYSPSRSLSAASATGSSLLQNASSPAVGLLNTQKKAVAPLAGDCGLFFFCGAILMGIVTTFLKFAGTGYLFVKEIFPRGKQWFGKKFPELDAKLTEWSHSVKHKFSNKHH